MRQACRTGASTGYKYLVKAKSTRYGADERFLFLVLAKLFLVLLSEKKLEIFIFFLFFLDMRGRWKFQVLAIHFYSPPPLPFLVEIKRPLARQRMGIYDNLNWSFITTHRVSKNESALAVSFLKRYESPSAKRDSATVPKHQIQKV